MDKHDSNVWGHHIVIPEEIARHFLDSTGKRIVLTINDKASYQGAIIPDGQGYWFVNINSAIRKELGLLVGEEIIVRLEVDESKYGLPMPEELEAILEQDPDADRLFHELTPGKQRNLLYIAGQPKNPDIRIRRGLVIARHLIEQQGKIDFKLLNQSMKAANRAARGEF